MQLLDPAVDPLYNKARISLGIHRSSFQAVGGVLRYEKPFVTDLGSISENTWTTPGGNIKGGGPIYHLDKFCEPSGCTSANDPECINLCPEGQTPVFRDRNRGGN